MPYRSEETYRQLFERHPAPMFVFDAETLRFVAVNDASLRTYGYTREAFLAMTIEDIRPDEDRERVREAVSDPDRGRVSSEPWRHVRKDGTVFEVAVSSNDIEFGGRPARLVLAEDVTERNHLQRRLQQIYKMEALGQLAGGVAHDFNNLLTAIGGFTALALDSLAEADAPARDHLRQVQRAVKQASDLTRQLLAYSRQQVLDRTSLHLNRVIRESETLLRRVLPVDVVITTDLAHDLGYVLADESQLSQVLMNLAVNARDAMPDGGRITIRTRNVELDQAVAAELDGAPPGAYVLLEFDDSGAGMDEATKAHLFEPFFTTKPAGQGTGLGLATVFGIIRQSEGYITADSEPGVGTTFAIYLPRDDTSTGGETILVVDDETTVRTLIEKLLTGRGYTVLTAAGPEEALRLVYAHDVDAVVSDVMMPVQSGPELVEEMRRHRPHVRALFTSGYPVDALADQGLGDGEVAFVQKPFTAQQLTSSLRQLLDA